MGRVADRLRPEDHDWLRDPAGLAVMDALLAAAPGGARYVGGCVRNALLGAPVSDTDIATVLTPPQTVAALEAAGLKAIPTGIDHGTVTAVSGKRGFEVTTLRKDVATDGRRAVVAFSTDWSDDAARRDFRLNAIYADRDGQLFDPVGGIDDAMAGRIRFIGEPGERITEDYLRILRFYRFHAWYARTPLDPEGHAACLALKAGLGQLSAERVWLELKKLLAAPDPREVLEAMQEGNVLNEVLPERIDLKLFLSLHSLQAQEFCPPDPLLRVAALLAGGDAMRVDALCGTMKVSNAERTRLHAAVRRVGVHPGMDRVALRAALYEQGRQAVEDQLLLAAARGEGRRDVLSRDLDAVSRWQRPAFPLKAADLLAIGLERGPALGRTLKALEARWVESDFVLGRADLLAIAQQPGES
ncbi:poly polymerase [Glycocaulis alkaliphilus]|uniref:Poly polymerase n=1 Tax=Glycocaulis alkaliphilus TaxID=1434191 RepID=A0A3T0E6N0_9PROT|nr:CCA tRNA nucleotidyltransferase [Glycocaulis alkaliphilus]AZU02959.1 poly polymerase [Glycocaulis alkaliphilus]GGB69865.1 poly(A) polymerase/tRNA-nucleotidyltransferase [Glycocaulis alkaliphilus]